MSRVVLVTGVSRDLGARFARALATDETLEVIGVDVSPPRHDLGKVSFVRADIRNPVIGKVIKSRGVETVVHMAIVANPGTAGRSSMKEINVIGTMQLLAACQKADSFRKLVVQSSVSVYGASPRDPVKFTEDMSPRVQPRTGFAKDSLEIESYVRGLGRRRPDVAVTTLRLANLMGAGVDSQMTRYLSLPVVPRVMGFDARLQFLHPTDAVGALLAVTRDDHPGTYNVGAPDIVSLTQALRLMGRPTAGVPLELAPLLAGMLRQARLGDWSSDQIAALTYGRAMDTTRFVTATGLKPRFTSRAALEEFVGVSSPGSAESRAGRSGAVRSHRSARGSPPWLRRRSSSWAAGARPVAGRARRRPPPPAGSPPAPSPARPGPGARRVRPPTAPRRSNRCHRDRRRGHRRRAGGSGAVVPEGPEQLRRPSDLRHRRRRLRRSGRGRGRHR